MKTTPFFMIVRSKLIRHSYGDSTFYTSYENSCFLTEDQKFVSIVLEHERKSWKKDPSFESELYPRRRNPVDFDAYVEPFPCSSLRCKASAFTSTINFNDLG